MCKDYPRVCVCVCVREHLNIECENLINHETGKWEHRNVEQANRMLNFLSARCATSCEISCFLFYASSRASVAFCDRPISLFFVPHRRVKVLKPLLSIEAATCPSWRYSGSSSLRCNDSVIFHRSFACWHHRGAPQTERIGGKKGGEESEMLITAPQFS